MMQQINSVVEVDIPLALGKEVSYKARVQFFIEEVLHWTCYTTWPAYAMEVLHQIQPDAAYPICYWSADSCWMLDAGRDEHCVEFDPYKSLDQAWELVESDTMQDCKEALLQGVRWWDIEKESFCREICDAVEAVTLWDKEHSTHE